MTICFSLGFPVLLEGYDRNPLPPPLTTMLGILQVCRGPTPERGNLGLGPGNSGKGCAPLRELSDAPLTYRDFELVCFYPTVITAMRMLSPYRITFDHKGFQMYIRKRVVITLICLTNISVVNMALVNL